jgi:alpha-ketoglutarate-dependent sulfate ester dioxygenase
MAQSSATQHQQQPAPASAAHEQAGPTLVVRPVAGYLGADISGVDLAGALPEDAVEELRAALLEHRVLFFRDQELDHDTHVALGWRFGELTSRPQTQTGGEFDQYPEILTISPEVDRDRYGLDYEAHYRTRWTSPLSGWHTDISHAVTPPAISITRADEAPPVGGDTIWTNLVAAYSGLSRPVRDLVDRLRAEHSFFAGYRMIPHDPVDRAILDQVGTKPMIAVHPVVRVHPETGERGLFVNPSRTGRILDLTPPESTALLDLLFAEITRSQYTVRFRWEPGSVAIWDNRATAHIAATDVDHLPGARRVLHRVTVVGDRPVGPDGFVSEAVSGVLPAADGS